jgi:hypothetical protein
VVWLEEHEPKELVIVDAVRYKKKDGENLPMAKVIGIVKSGEVDTEVKTHKSSKRRRKKP